MISKYPCYSHGTVGYFLISPEQHAMSIHQNCTIKEILMSIHNIVLFRNKKRRPMCHNTNLSDLLQKLIF